MKFIYDTGAEHVILFKRHYTDIMNVRYDRRIPILGADLSNKVYALVARRVNLQFDNMPIIEKDILVLEEDYFKLDKITGTQIDGIIGGEFFKNKIVHINYRNQKITVYNPKKYEIPTKGFTELDIHIKSNKPYTFTNVTTQNGEVHQLEFLLDTGSGIPLLVHNNTTDGLGLPEQYIAGNLGVGLGGTIQGYVGRVQKLEFGGHTFDQVLTNFQDVAQKIELSNSNFRNGLIGNEILSRFHVYIDYLQEKMYIKPNKKLKRKFDMDRSGLVIFAAGKSLNVYVVQEVLPNSPGEEAGILKGDIIKVIGSVPTRFMRLDGLLRKLQKKPDKRIKLQILRGGKIIKKAFKLRDLI